MIDALRDAQPSLRDQIAVQLLGRLGLHKSELRLLRVRDFDLTRGTVKVLGKGNKTVVLPIGFRQLRADLEVHLVGLGESEFLLFPWEHRTRPMFPVFHPSSLHRGARRLPFNGLHRRYDRGHRRAYIRRS
jgi:integrase